MSDVIDVGGVRMQKQWIVIWNDQAGDDCSSSEVFNTEEEAREFLDNGDAAEWKAQLICGYDLKVEDRT